MSEKLVDKIGKYRQISLTWDVHRITQRVQMKTKNMLVKEF
jgi:hypothetical protein